MRQLVILCFALGCLAYSGVSGDADNEEGNIMKVNEDDTRKMATDFNDGTARQYGGYGKYDNYRSKSSGSSYDSGSHYKSASKHKPSAHYSYGSSYEYASEPSYASHSGYKPSYESKSEPASVPAPPPASKSSSSSESSSSSSSSSVSGPPPPPQNALLYDPYYTQCCIDIAANLKVAGLSVGNVTHAVDRNIHHLGSNREDINSIIARELALQARIEANAAAEQTILRTIEMASEDINKFISILSNVVALL